MQNGAEVALFWGGRLGDRGEECVIAVVNGVVGAASCPAISQVDCSSVCCYPAQLFVTETEQRLYALEGEPGPCDIYADMDTRNTCPTFMDVAQISL